ncbi:MAG TPA: tetratricopeptide repeat protein [Thermoanaerobaculia bacterium]|nr:tetratricopeptide repeat protein [Thermoanaerobaculia bacterium]
MRLIIVRLATPFLFLLFGNGFAWAEDLPTPALFHAVMSKSKLHYEIGAPLPLASPVKELSCYPRPNELRRVRSGDGWSLTGWKPADGAAPHFAKAEELFGQKLLPEAAVEYRRGLELDPDYGPGWLYSGDVPFHKGDYEAALTAYRKALALDPTLAQAHRFAADALLKLGRLDDAETEYVRALVYQPSYDGAWSGLELLGRLAGFKVNRPAFSPPDGTLGERQGDKVPIGLAEKDMPWLGYFLCKAVWRNEPEYRQSRGVKGEEYAWSTREERECLFSYLTGTLALAKDDPANLSPQARHLQAVVEAGLLDGYLIVADLGPRCPIAVPLLPEDALDQAEQYIRRFAIVRPSGGK